LNRLAALNCRIRNSKVENEMKKIAACLQGLLRIEELNTEELSLLRNQLVQIKEVMGLDLQTLGIQLRGDLALLGDIDVASISNDFNAGAATIDRDCVVSTIEGMDEKQMGGDYDAKKLQNELFNVEAELEECEWGESDKDSNDDGEITPSNNSLDEVQQALDDLEMSDLEGSEWGNEEEVHINFTPLKPTLEPVPIDLEAELEDCEWGSDS
jgi:hypothetical protein